MKELLCCQVWKMKFMVVSTRGQWSDQVDRSLIGCSRFAIEGWSASQNHESQ